MIRLALVASLTLACKRSPPPPHLRNPLGLRVPFYYSYSSLEFVSLCKLAKVPCGIELTRSREPGEIKVVQNLGMPNVLVKSVLEKLVQGPWKGYAWAVNDGVLDIGPLDFLSHRKQSPLDKRLSYVDLTDVKAAIAIEELCERAGVASRSKNFEMLASYTGNVSLHLRNVTVREALDAVVRAEGGCLWLIEPLQGAPRVTVYSFESPPSSDGHAR